MSLPPDPSAGVGDNYAGEPGRPDPWTTKAPREGLRDTDEARVVSLSPDVCLMPRGGLAGAGARPGTLERTDRSSG